jgi:hypothetical protein
MVGSTEKVLKPGVGGKAEGATQEWKAVPLTLKTPDKSTGVGQARKISDPLME